MGRSRVRLVPEDGVEIFEIRVALWFDKDGQRRVATCVSNPDTRELETVDMVEVLGALEGGREKLKVDYDYEP